MAEYEADRWRIIAGKVGSGFSAAACREKAAELEEEKGEGGTIAVAEAPAEEEEKEEV